MPYKKILFSVLTHAIKFFAEWRVTLWKTSCLSARFGKSRQPCRDIWPVQQFIGGGGKAPAPVWILIGCAGQIWLLRFCKRILNR